MPRVAETIAQTLKAYDTDYFFLVTGGDQALWIALQEAGICMVSCRNEAAAVYMADAYARVTGKPGFVYGQFGPGVANVVGALADSYWSMSPVISLTSAMPSMSKDRYEYQELDQLPMHTSVTKWNKTVTRPERVADMLRSAIRAATGSVPGPVHLEIPADILNGDMDEVAIYKEPSFGKLPSLRSAPPAEAVSALVDALLSAQRPVLIAGNGVLISQAWEELQTLAELLSLPVATSMGGKGAISEEHELALGIVGRYSRKTTNDIVRECDLALVIGCQLGALATDSYTVPSSQTRILHIDTDTNVLGAIYREEISVLADAKLALQAMIDEVRRRGSEQGRSAWARSTFVRMQNWKEHVQQTATRAPGNPIHPATAIQALRAALRPEDIVVADTGYMGAWTGALYPVTAPGRTFLRAAGSLGWAFPAALGATLAAPDKHVVCVSGDGGIGYHIGEIETALRYNIPTTVVILNNVMYAYEYHGQKYLWDNKIISQVNDFVDVDYSAVARAFGANGERITDARDLPGALHDALHANKLTVLDVMVDKEASAPVTTFETVVERTI
jgi:acetolactate synthase I/II/III large subunit